MTAAASGESSTPWRGQAAGKFAKREVGDRHWRIFRCH
jgi:hypothetical protein